MLQGHIPERVIYVAGAARRVRICWEDDDTRTVVDEEVRPCFAADKHSQKSLATAKTWAQARRGKQAVTQEERANSPFDVRICGMEVRGRGGRAYKVITDDGYWFDLREDVLLDGILHAGIARGGKINAKFVWGQVGSQMKLVRVDSALHQALIQGGKRKSADKINHADLVAGGLYRNVKGERFLLLGRVNTTEFTHINPPPAGAHQLKKEAVREGVTRSSRLNMLLFLEMPDWAAREKTARKWLDAVLSLKESFYTHYFKIQKSLAVIEHLESVELRPDVLTLVRQAAAKNIQGESKGRKSDRLSHACYLSWLANVVAPDAQPGISPEFQPYLDVIAPLLDGSKAA